MQTATMVWGPSPSTPHTATPPTERLPAPPGQSARITGLVVASFVWLVPIISVPLLALGQSPGPSALILAIVGALGLGNWLVVSEGGQKRHLVFAGLTLAGLIVAATALSLAFFDLSYDGQFYHQEAILRLMEGWNPLRDAPLELHPDRQDHDYAIWVNAYPKAAWYGAAAAARTLNAIEAGKLFHWLLLAGAGLLVYGVIRGLHRPRAQALMIAALMAMNPVALNQVFSYYVDGLLASTLVSLLALGVWLAHREDRGNRSLCFTFSLGLIYLVNLKYTGLIYAGIAGGMLVLWAWRTRASNLRKLSALWGISLLIGVAGIGAHPYLSNWVRHGHPLHPLFGENAMDVIHTQFDSAFLDLPSPVRVALSLISRSANDRAYPIPKLPFTVDMEELRAFVENDTRIGGFGPLFSGICLLSLISLAVARGRPRSVPNALVFITGGVLISILVNPAAWWARFAPQLWWMPILALWRLLDEDRRVARALSLALILGLELNLALTSIPHGVVQRVLSVTVREQLAFAAEASLEHPVGVTFHYFDPLRRRLEEAGVAYRAELTPSCQEPWVLLGSRVQICAGSRPWPWEEEAGR